jgi:predicted ABC-type ATPase
VDEFVNADAIALGLSAFRPESAAIAAGRAMIERLGALSRGRRDFAFETTLSGRGLLARVEALRRSGYHVHLVFVSLPSPDLALSRVAERVRQGGHDVPAHVVVRRFSAGLRNLFGRCQSGVDSWQVFDNSQPGGPALVARQRQGQRPEILDAEAWRVLKEQAK